MPACSNECLLALLLYLSESSCWCSLLAINTRMIESNRRKMK